MIRKQQGSQRRGTRTGDRAVHNGAILELYGYCLIVQFHQKPAHAILQAFLSLLALSTWRNTKQHRKKKLKPPDNQVSRKTKHATYLTSFMVPDFLSHLLAFVRKELQQGQKLPKFGRNAAPLFGLRRFLQPSSPRAISLFFSPGVPSCCRSSCLGYRGRVDLGRAGPGRGFPASDPRPLLQWRRVLLPKFV